MPTTALLQGRGGAPTPKCRTVAHSGPLDFPANHHLLVTTANHILCWNRNGLTSIFASSSGGIVAAKEARDAGGKLAVADGLNVLVHDVRRGMEGTYRLKRNQGHVRMLEFAPDSKTLYFTTSLSNAVQSHWLNEQDSRLLDALYPHPSPPTVFAINSTGQTAVSASEGPVCIHVQNLALRSPPSVLRPRASDATVSLATFHPDRPNVFLLGFADGTIAAYNSVHVSRVNKRLSREGSSADGQIGRFRGLFTVRAASEDHNLGAASTLSIVGAAFIPGFRTRAVAVGADGRCKLLDFAEGGKVLRSWHIRGPATSLSILPLHSGMSASSQQQMSSKVSSPPGQDSDAMTIIAFGRADGKVVLYDSIGLLLGEKAVVSGADPVLGLQWMDGPAPRPAMGSDHVRFSEDNAIDMTQFQSRIVPHSSRRTSAIKNTNVHKTSAASQTSSQTPRVQAAALDGGYATPKELSRPTSIEMFNVESKDFSPEFPSTVRRSDAKPGPHLPPSLARSNYMDLFSPAKPTQNSADVSPRRVLTGIKSRKRPRISSTTFVNTIESPASPKSSAAPLKAAVRGKPSLSPAKHLTLPHALPDPEIGVQSPQSRLPPTSPMESTSCSLLDSLSSEYVHSAVKGKRVKTSLPRRRSARHVSFNHRMPGYFSTTSSNLSSISPYDTPDVTEDAKILAGLTKADRKKSDTPGNGLALFAPYMARRKQSDTANSKVREGIEVELASSSVNGLGESARPCLSDLSTNSSATDDIWLTSDSDVDVRSARRRTGRVANMKSGKPQAVRYRRASERSSLTLSSKAPSHLDDKGSSTSSSALSNSLIDSSESEATLTPTQTYYTAPQTTTPLKGAVQRPGSVPGKYTESSSSQLSPTQSPRSRPTVQRPSLAHQLDPGKADSPEGPVTVGRYFPRHSSFVNFTEARHSSPITTSSPEKRAQQRSPFAKARAKRVALGEIAGNGRSGQKRQVMKEGTPQQMKRSGNIASEKHTNTFQDPDVWENVESAGDEAFVESPTKAPPSNLGYLVQYHGHGEQPPNGVQRSRSQDPQTCACAGACCGELRKEVQGLRDEVKILRQLMKGVIISSPKKRRSS